MTAGALQQQQPFIRSSVHTHMCDVTYLFLFKKNLLYNILIYIYTVANTLSKSLYLSYLFIFIIALFPLSDEVLVINVGIHLGSGKCINYEMII